MSEIVKLDQIRRENIPLLLHDLESFVSSDRERWEGTFRDHFTGKESVEFYEGLVTACDYAAGMELNRNNRVPNQAFVDFYTRSMMAAYVLEQVAKGKTSQFEGDVESGLEILDKPLSVDELEQIVPNDSIYDYSELFLGDKSDEFYQGLVKGFDVSAKLAQSRCKNTNTHIQLDLMTMFVAYKILEKLGKKPGAEVLSPKEYKPVIATDGLIGYEKI